MTALWPHGDPRAVARAILSDPRFARAAQRPAEKTWLERVGELLGRAWSWLTEPFHHLSGSAQLATILGAVVLIAMLGFLLVVIVLFAERAWPRARGPAQRALDAASAAGADARTLLARALDAAAAGRHRDAAALLWASALRALDERGRVRFDAARTPGEWRRAVGDPSFDLLARDAVIALFGDRADAALVERMREAYERVVTA